MPVRKPITVILSIEDGIIYRDLIFKEIGITTDPERLTKLHALYGDLAKRIHNVEQAKAKGYRPDLEVK